MDVEQTVRDKSEEMFWASTEIITNKVHIQALATVYSVPPLAAAITHCFDATNEANRTDLRPEAADNPSACMSTTPI